MAGSGTGIYDQLPHKKNNGDDDDPDLNADLNDGENNPNI